MDWKKTVSLGQEGGERRRGCAPRPPMIRTTGLSSWAVLDASAIAAAAVLDQGAGEVFPGLMSCWVERFLEVAR